MAKYDIKYSCGHVEEKNLLGKIAGRTSYVDWARDNAVCSACRAAAAERAIEAVEVEHELPALVGSPKQTKWARQIRSEKLVAALAAASDARKHVPAERVAAFDAKTAALTQHLVAQANASWWIERRDVEIREFIGKAYAEARG